jgi:uncharacterized OsmC-like protein
MADEMKTKVGIKLAEDMIFKCDLGSMKVEDCYIDEVNKEEVDMLGPNPSRMLALAVLGCLSASFIFCLKKKDFAVNDLNAEAEVTITRNEQGFWRVKRIDVQINPEIQNKDAIKRIEQCLKVVDSIPFFQKFCSVTEAVRSGIEINVNIDVK